MFLLGLSSEYFEFQVLFSVLICETKLFKYKYFFTL